MGILGRRLAVIASGGLLGAIAIGLLARTPVMLVAGIIALGFAMIAAILFYLIRPVPSEPLAEFAVLGSNGPAPAKLPARPRLAAGPSELVRTSGEVIPFPRRPGD